MGRRRTILSHSDAGKANPCCIQQIRRIVLGARPRRKILQRRGADTSARRSVGTKSIPFSGPARRNVLARGELVDRPMDNAAAYAISAGIIGFGAWIPVAGLSSSAPSWSNSPPVSSRPCPVASISR
jgi:hypothetical protein